MPTNGPPLIIYIDVDDTLIRSAGTKRIPDQETVNGEAPLG